jgi:hypothetical protein
MVVHSLTRHRLPIGERHAQSAGALGLVHVFARKVVQGHAGLYSMMGWDNAYQHASAHVCQV